MKFLKIKIQLLPKIHYEIQYFYKLIDLTIGRPLHHPNKKFQSHTSQNPSSPSSLRNLTSSRARARRSIQTPLSPSIPLSLFASQKPPPHLPKTTATHTFFLSKTTHILIKLSRRHENQSSSRVRLAPFSLLITAHRHLKTLRCLHIYRYIPTLTPTPPARISCTYIRIHTYIPISSRKRGSCARAHLYISTPARADSNSLSSEFTVAAPRVGAQGVCICQYVPIVVSFFLSFIYKVYIEPGGRGDTPSFVV